jgi:nucleotide-binding universal stress UspA family protein
LIPIRSIVAATDLSAPARHAADRAARLAEEAGAALTLVHAVGGSMLDELRRWLGAEDNVPEVLLAGIEQRLHQQARDVADRYRIEAGARLVVGNVVDCIVREADARGAELLVTGTRGSTFVRTMLLGSTAERLVKRSCRPVLMVRQIPHEPYGRVLVPVDFSEWSLAALELALRVAPHSRFVLMHAVAVPFEAQLRYANVEQRVVEQYRVRARHDAQDRLAALAARAGVPAGRWVGLTPDSGDPWMQILREEQEQDCDLVVIGKHGRGVLEELMLGSTTRMIIAQSTGDVLVSTARQGDSADAQGAGP